MLKILIMNIIEKINKEFANKSYYEKQFSEFAAKCYDLHKNVNQTYDDNPFFMHHYYMIQLRMQDLPIMM